MKNECKLSKTLLMLKIYSLAFVIFRFELAEGKFLHEVKAGGSLYDLTVDAVLFDKDTLQANISWKSNNLGDQKLDVRFNPLPSEACSNKPCVVYGLDSDTTEVLLPPDPMPILEHRECTVEPGCVYTVYVETADRKVQQNINYTVPDCVDSVCSCKHAKLLPSTFVNATFTGKLLTVYWKVASIAPKSFEDETNDIELDSVDISVGIQNNPSLTWGGQYKNITEIQQSLQNDSGIVVKTEGFHMVNLTDAVDNETEYRILVRAHVVDMQGCHGKDGNFTHTVRPVKTKVVHKTNDKYVWMFIITLSVALGLLVLAFIFVFRHMQKRVRKEKAILNWRGVYHNVPAGGCTCRENVQVSKMEERQTTEYSIINKYAYFSNQIEKLKNAAPHIVLQENCIYVDKDILDARARGEADNYEIPHSALTIGRSIGKGAFGRVYLARADNIGGIQGSQLVAVKKLRKRPTPDEMEEFLSEIAMMKSVSKHQNIVSLIGCCTIKQPLLMVMEYIGCGDLLKYLRQLRDKHEARSINVTGIANQRQSLTSSTITLVPSNYNICNTNNNSNNNNNNSSSTTNMSSTATTVINNNLGPVGKYLELIHSPMNSSSSNGTSNSDASYVTRAESISSTMRASEAETMYTILSQNVDLMSATTFEYVLDHKELHSFAIQIARGMRHLEERHITHRDLAARNVLIDENKRLKISDFGLSRTGIYVNTRNKKVPIRWLSLEALRDNLYSTKSDVWAFGIVLWEIGTLGGMPYPNVSNHEILPYVQSGQRMQRPENCSELLYDLMTQCWSESPEDRPFFSEVVSLLETAGGENEQIYVDFNDLAPNYVFPPTRDDMKALKEFDEFGENESILTRKV